jgi:hypothetical protein
MGEQLHIRAFSASALYRWTLVAIVAAVCTIGLARMNFQVDMAVVRKAFAAAALLYGLGLVLAIAARWTRVFFFVGSSDFFCSAAQTWTLLIFAAGLQYVAAAANLPLADDLLRRADAALGFDWAAYSAWVGNAERPGGALALAYWSPYFQMMVLFAAHAMRRDQDGNGEFIWCYAVSLLTVIGVSAFLPAIGYEGMLGRQHIDVFLAAREGTVSDVSGIVSFPSFHAAMGVLFIYSVRAILPLLVFSVPLNVLLICATPACGGHYLVDTIAGMAVALLAIALVRSFNASPAGAGQVSRAMAPA